MVASTCTSCNELKNIVYSDYAFSDRTSKPAFVGYPIKFCFDCLNFAGWKEEIQKIIPFIHKCPQCGQKYMTKKSDSKKCAVCWSKFWTNKNQITIQIKQEDKHGEDRELQCVQEV